MGLDMYVNANLGISRNSIFSEFPSKKIEKKIDSLLNEIKNIYPVLDKADEMSFDIFYWRKVNWLHKWFVTNLQEGVDDCKSYTFDKSLLTDLLIR